MQTRDPYPDLIRSPQVVLRVRPVCVYYVFWGRNAWWSTWITRYNPGCIHTDFESARRYCEPKRVQGTVFYINELPALACESPSKTLLVTQINTADPLGQADSKRLRELRPLQKDFVSFWDLYSFLQPYSSVWPKSFPKANSVIQAWCDEPKELQDLDVGNPLDARTSYSNGVGYYLGWSKRESGIKAAGIVRLAQALNEDLKRRSDERKAAV